MVVRTITQGFFETLLETQYLPPEDLAEYQRDLLEKLLRHARTHVPFYRDRGRLDPLFRADGSIDWGRWLDIPPLTRKELQEQGRSLRSEVVPPGFGKVMEFSTSGSTGEPVRVIDTELARRWAWAALRLRDFRWHGIDPTQRLVRLYAYPFEMFDATGVNRAPSWRTEFEPLNLSGERLDVSDLHPAPRLIEIVASLQPTYLQASVTPLQLMIAHDRSRVLPGLKLSAVYTFAEHFPAEAKRAAEAYLGCRIFELYGSSECGFMASSCGECGGFHAHAEIVLTEVLAEDGSTAKPGAIGGLLATPLYNYAMPLIRYEHADFVELSAPGGCDICLPRFDTILGKKRDPFVFSGGRVVRPYLSADVVSDRLGALVFQVAQVAPDRCEFRFVAGALPHERMRFDEMTDLMRSLWWDGLQVDYRIVDELPRRTVRSKTQQFVQEMPAATVMEMERLAGVDLRLARPPGA
jgi:phenylacetate-CoA ligase